MAISFRKLSIVLHYPRTWLNGHQTIDLELALRLSGWSELAPTSFGVRCPNCKMILAAPSEGVLPSFLDRSWRRLRIRSARHNDGAFVTHQRVTYRIRTGGLRGARAAVETTVAD